MQNRRYTMLRVLTVLVLLWVAGQGTSSACAVCYGDAEGPMIKAASMGVYLMIAVVAVVQSCFAAFFIMLWRRARKINNATLSVDKESCTS